MCAFIFRVCTSRPRPVHVFVVRVGSKDAVPWLPMISNYFLHVHLMSAFMFIARPFFFLREHK